MGRLINVLHRFGLKLDKHQTIREYLPQAEARLGKEWVAFTRLFEQARYGVQSDDEQNTHTARDLFKRMLGTLLYSRKKR